jgi:hypothetical protein
MTLIAVPGLFTSSSILVMGKNGNPIAQKRNPQRLPVVSQFNKSFKFSLLFLWHTICFFI